jgi:hypothetical protein
VYARVRQLAHLATGAADRLLAGAEILDATGAGLPVEIDDSLLVTLTDQHAWWEAGRRVALVTHLTALGADDALATAELFVTERFHRGFPPLHHPPALTATQDAALGAVARGDVTISRDKPFVRHENLRVSISTIRALEARRLVGREKFPEWSHYERVHLPPKAAAILPPRSAGRRPPRSPPGVRQRRCPEPPPAGPADAPSPHPVRHHHALTHGIP